MIVNGKTLLAAAPIFGMQDCKRRMNGVSFGLTEAGYDVRIRETVTLHPLRRFVLASTVERFQMPEDLCGFVMGKSTWARRGVNVQATLIEPGWRGYLTIEIHLQTTRIVRIEAGSGIAAVLFARLSDPARYDGAYQDQPDRPVESVAW